MIYQSPLKWPANRPRTPWHDRRSSAFSVDPEKAVRELGWEIERMGGDDIVLSSNCGLTRAGALSIRDLKAELPDPGVAVYFSRKGAPVAFWNDRHARPWENIRAIGKTIEALRAIDRYGSGDMADAAFTGFTALPPAGPSCWDVLGVDPGAARKAINDAYRQKARAAGSEAALKELNIARDAAMQAAR